MTAKTVVRHVVSAAMASVRSRWGTDRRVLLYHAIEPRPSSRDVYTVRPEALERHIAIARSLGYEIISISRATSWTARPARRELVIVFDDGYRSVLDHAAPVLLRSKTPAACMLVPAAISGASTWEAAMRSEPKPILSWDEARQLCNLGFELGSHSMRHQDLTLLSDKELARDVLDSKSVIEEHTGRTIQTFSVPFGRDDGRTDLHLRRTGYNIKVTHQLAPMSSAGGLLTVPCTAIEQGDDDGEFVRKLTGAYDWLAWYHRGRGRYPLKRRVLQSR